MKTNHHLLLAIDIGNTHTVFGIFDGNKLIADWRISSAIPHTEDEIGAQVLLLCQHAGINASAIRGVGISSVVPNLTDIFEMMAKKYFNVKSLIIHADLNLGIKILYEDPSMVGADRLCNSVAGYTRYGGPLIIIDFGTATTYDVVSKRGEYLGGIIAPGIETSALDLHRRAAKLPKVELRFPKDVIGTNTVASMQAGIMYGAVDAMEGMVKRIRNAIGKKAKVIATGGYSKLLKQASSIVDFYEPTLVLDGVRIIYYRLTDC